MSTSTICVKLSTSTFCVKPTQFKSELAPLQYQVQICNSVHRKIAPKDALNRTNTKSEADVSPIQMIGLQQQLDFSKMKNEALEEQLRPAGVHINVRSDDQQDRIKETDLDMTARRDKKTIDGRPGQAAHTGRE